MAERVVEHLEAVEIDEHQAERPVRLTAAFDFTQQRGTVREARERIGVGEPVQFRDALLLDCDVFRDADDAQHIAFVVEHRVAGAAQPAHRAVGFSDPVLCAAFRRFGHDAHHLRLQRGAVFRHDEFAPAVRIAHELVRLDAEHVR